MFFSVATLGLALLATSASAEIHYVKIGGDNLVFSPEAIVSLTVVLVGGAVSDI
jgi:hypothetical protein